MARPSDYTDEIAEEICAWIAGGRSLRSFCRKKNTPDVTTVCRWIPLILVRPLLLERRQTLNQSEYEKSEKPKRKAKKCTA